MIAGLRLALAAGHSRTVVNDEYAIWSLRGRALALAGRLDLRVFANPEALYQHLDYPLLVPSLLAWTSGWGGGDAAWHVQVALMTAALLLVVAWGVTRLAGPLAGAVAVVVVLAPYGLGRQAVRVYADLPAAAYAVAVVLLLLLWLRDRDAALLRVAAVMATGAAYTKNEGAVYALAACLVAAAVARRIAPLLAGAGALAAYAPWLAWTRLHDLGNDVVNADAGARAALDSERVRLIATGLLDSWPLPLWWLLLAAVTVVLAVRAGHTGAAVLLLGTAAAAVAAVAATYVVTPLEVTSHIRTSAPRVLMFPALLSALAVPLLAGTLRRTASPPEPAEERRVADRHPNEPIPAENAPKDACGVFGVWAPGEDVAKLTYYGLYALQHRGQEAAGIAVSDMSNVIVYKDLGLVAQVFDEPTLATLTGHVAIGHTRYSTTGSCNYENAQPSFKQIRGGRGSIALGHNGNLTNTSELARELADAKDGMGATSDSDLITTLLAANPDVSVEEAAMTVLPRLRGAFSLVFMDERTLYATRDRNGVRPLVLGRLERGWVVASETAALDIVGASFLREVEPGELVAIDSEGVRSRQWADPEPKGCLFEYVYLARPDTTIAGRGVHVTRVEVGRQLAREAPAPGADLVMPVPESGGPAAIGYADESGIPYGEGLVKNRYVGRTFIQPSDTIRQLGIRLKLNPVRDIVRGKKLVVVDDSIVRGNTQRAQVRMLREAGASEIHVRISSPPVKWPCFYGIDFATKAELIANAATLEEICAHIGADSLAYVSLDGLVKATTLPGDRLCRACFDGAYPIELPAAEQLGKHLLEEMTGADSGADALMPGVGAADALRRP